MIRDHHRVVVVRIALLALAALPLAAAAAAEDPVSPYVDAWVGVVYAGNLDYDTRALGRAATVNTDAGFDLALGAGVDLGPARGGVSLEYAYLPVSDILASEPVPDDVDALNHFLALFELGFDIPIIEDRLEGNVLGGFGSVGQFSDFSSGWSFAYRAGAGLTWRLSKRSPIGLGFGYTYTAAANGFEAPVAATVGGARADWRLHQLRVGIRYTPLVGD